MLRTLCFLPLLLAAACASTAPVVYTQQTVSAPPAMAGPAGPVAGTYQPNAYLRTCSGMAVSNAPTLVGEGWLAHYAPVIVVRGVVLASIPVNDVCLSSGFGIRAGKFHEGIDLSARPAGPVYAAAPGRIIEARNANGYGLQVLIDHGKGVYTRYAHLAYFNSGIAVGQQIGFGQPVGMMGRSGNATAIHLHYEVLTGNYNNPRGSKGLQVNDPFSFPAYEYTIAGS